MKEAGPVSAFFTIAFAKGAGLIKLAKSNKYVRKVSTNMY